MNATLDKEPASLTVWDDPSAMLTSQYGRTTYRDWCEREAARMRARDRNVAVRTNGNTCAVVYV